MNDPVALLLVTGFIDWIEDARTTALVDMVGDAGRQARARPGARARDRLRGPLGFRNLDLPSPGLYPVASIATAALAYGVPEVLHGSGFLSVYIAALVLGTGPVPAQPTTVAFHQGLAWVAQISLFALLGLLVFPSGLGDVAVEGLALSAVLMFVARPLAAFIASALVGLHRARAADARLGRASRGDPDLARDVPGDRRDRGGAADLQLDLLRRRHLDADPGRELRAAGPAARRDLDEPALPEAAGRDRDHPPARRRVVRLARRTTGDAAVGRTVKDLGLPREALVNLIVRGGEAIPPRGSTEIEAGDELHVVVRLEALREVEALTAAGARGRSASRAVPRCRRAARRRCSRSAAGAPRTATRRHPTELEGAAVVARLRIRRDEPARWSLLADGRYAVTSTELLAVGGRSQLGRWCARRVARPASSRRPRLVAGGRRRARALAGRPREHSTAPRASGEPSDGASAASAISR